MPNRKGEGALLPALALILIAAVCAPARAQEGESSRPQGAAQSRAEINYEVQLHLLVTAEGAEGAPRVPQSLDAVVRQLKAALPNADYRVAASFVNRVRDGGSLEVKNAGPTSSGSAQPPNKLLPTFYQFTLTGVKLVDPASTQPTIGVGQFRLGMRAPMQTATAGGGFPVIQYEDVGLSTQLSVREGEPTLVGSISADGTGRLYVIVLVVRRAR